MILKAGTYMFNWVPYIQPREQPLEQSLHYMANLSGEFEFECTRMNVFYYETEENLLADFSPYIEFANGTESETPFDYDGWYWSGFPSQIKILENQEVIEDFYDFFVNSTDYNKVNNQEEKVIGWRKLKQGYQPLILNEDYAQSMQNTLGRDCGFVIEPIDGSDKISCVFRIYITDTYFQDGFFARTSNGLFKMITPPELDGLIFKVLSTDSSTVDQWLRENTEPIEVEEPVVDIYYEGNKVASLQSGETTQVLAEDLRLTSDVVIKANAGYIKNKDTSDATATSNTILAPYTAYINGEKIEGTIPTYDGSYTGGVEGGSSSGADYIECETLPTENIDTSKIYRLKKVTDLILCTDGSQTPYVSLMQSFGANASICVVKTRPTENIKVSNSDDEIHFYYVEDENDVLMCDATNGWVSFSAEMGGAEFKGHVNHIDETTEDGYYLLIVEGYFKFVNNEWNAWNYTPTISGVWYLNETPTTPTVSGVQQFNFRIPYGIGYYSDLVITEKKIAFANDYLLHSFTDNSGKFYEYGCCIEMWGEIPQSVSYDFYTLFKSLFTKMENPIAFTIAYGILCYAPSGMTWNEYINTHYAPKLLSVVDGVVYEKPHSNSAGGNAFPLLLNGNQVLATDTIVDGAEYKRE